MKSVLAPGYGFASVTQSNPVRNVHFFRPFIDPTAHNLKVVTCRASQDSQPSSSSCTRRDAIEALLLGSLITGVGLLPAAGSGAATGNLFSKDLNKRRRKVPESDFKDGPEGLRYYDTTVGNGAVAREGARVAVHYEAKWRGVTFMTSRQGMGVTGGTPLGFDVGAVGFGGTLKGLDLGVRGMRVGGQRKLIVPPNLAYGERGYGEVPPDATLEVDLELLSIKTSPFGSRVKLVEG